MKTYSLRVACLVVNVCAGILTTLAVAVGVHVFAGSSASWNALLGLGIGCSLVALAANAIWLSGWVIPAFRQLARIIETVEPLRGAAEQFRPVNFTTLPQP